MSITDAPVYPVQVFLVDTLFPEKSHPSIAFFCLTCHERMAHKFYFKMNEPGIFIDCECTNGHKATVSLI